MPGSTILKFTDPDEYYVALRRLCSEDVRTVVTASGNYQSELMLVELHKLGLGHARTSLPRTVHGLCVLLPNLGRCTSDLQRNRGIRVSCFSVFVSRRRIRCDQYFG